VYVLCVCVCRSAKHGAQKRWHLLTNILKVTTTTTTTTTTTIHTHHVHHTHHTHTHILKHHTPYTTIHSRSIEHESFFRSTQTNSSSHTNDSEKCMYEWHMHAFCLFAVCVCVCCAYHKNTHMCYTILTYMSRAGVC